MHVFLSFFFFFLPPISESVFFSSFLRKIESLYPWWYRRIFFDRSILSIVRDIVDTVLCLWFHRIVTFQLGVQLAQCTMSRLAFFPFATLVHIFANDHRTLCIIRTNPFFTQWTVSFICEIASGDISFQNIRKERKWEREKEETKGKHSCQDLVAFLHGEIRMLLSNIPPLYPFSQFDLSSALSRGRKRRHGLTLFSKRVTPDFSTDSRYFSSHASYYFYSTVVATRNIAIDVSAKEPGGRGGEEGKWGDAFLRQFITRAGSRNLFEHLIYHSWNVNWYLKTRYTPAILG